MKENLVDVYVEICREGVVLPQYKNPGDAGMDIFAIEDTTIDPGQTKVLPTGLKFAIPEGFEIQVRPRSGISLHTPLRVSNSPGTIDAGYRDELGILMTNTSEQEYFEQTWKLDSKGNQKGVYHIQKGDRIAQIVLQRVPTMNFTVVQDVREIGNDRGGGFGSTGIR